MPSFGANQGPRFVIVDPEIKREFKILVRHAKSRSG